MLVWLRLIGRMASTSWQQVILHRDWGRHVATLRNPGIDYFEHSINLGDWEFSCASYLVIKTSTQSTGHMCKCSFFALKMIVIVQGKARPEAHGKCRLFAAAAAAGAFRDVSGTVGDHHLKNK